METIVENIILSLDTIKESQRKLTGNKAINLSKLHQDGFTIPQGFVITTLAYDLFLKHNNLEKLIDFELMRKPLELMRWEEIWDASLRIRNAFVSAKIPEELYSEIIMMVDAQFKHKKLAIRSSSSLEDTGNKSFAGLHESFINVTGHEDIINSIKVVWASLLSDAALLYKRELNLNPEKNQMAVIIQEMIPEKFSGVAFTMNPVTQNDREVVLELVEGLCQDLVDDIKPSYKYIYDKDTGVLTPQEAYQNDSLPTTEEIKHIINEFLQIESNFVVPCDIEWTGLNDRFTILQARPITTLQNTEKKEKDWYLSLRLSDAKLDKLCKEVEEKLIPALEVDGDRLAQENIDNLSIKELTSTIQDRYTLYLKWKKIYWDKFIPFAHGVRAFGQLYNDLLHPEDPYEFVLLLKNQNMLALQRNQQLFTLAQYLLKNTKTLKFVTDALSKDFVDWIELKNYLKADVDTALFIKNLDNIISKHFDIEFGNQRLDSEMKAILLNIVELTKKNSLFKEAPAYINLESTFFNSIPASKRDKAKKLLQIARISWRLRDDDNILFSRITYQLICVLELAVNNLKQRYKVLDNFDIKVTDAPEILKALKEKNYKPDLKLKSSLDETLIKNVYSKPRQILGQPASPGLVTGIAKVVKTLNDFKDFKSNDILVCDAIQPQITHLIPLASAIVERRGGMLIHGAIIARELGIPCVNGVSYVDTYIKSGDLVTVDGYLGIITLGEPEFNLELS